MSFPHRSWTLLLGLCIGANFALTSHAANDPPPDLGTALTTTQQGAFPGAQAGRAVSDEYDIIALDSARSNQPQQASLNEYWEDGAPAPAAVPAPIGPPPMPKKKKDFKKAVGGAYKPLFYDNKFDYVLDDAYDGYHLGEEFKRRCLGNNIMWDAGGEYRFRHHSENNLRGKPLSGGDDDFLLQRTRLFLNAEVGNRLRFYAEAVDATTSGQKLRPRGIEVNRFDAINLFGDVMLWEDYCSDGKLFGRVGRQELLLGAQRLVSPLDWSNTRRTFDGAKLFYTSKTWDVDAFWTRPVPFGQHLDAANRQDHNFDSPNDDQEFMGLYTSYKKAPGKVADFYYLRYADNSGTIRNINTNVGDFDYNLLGMRLAGGSDAWLWEFEGGVQFGDAADDNVEAGMFTIGLGRKFECVTWKPTLWFYYDWASGDSNPADNTVGTFNQYFPLAHKYLGWMDIIGRNNIQDVNMLLVLSPREKIKLLMWYHVFHLESGRDALYNAAGAPIYQDPTGGSGTDIGQEIDIALKWQFKPRASFLFGYSHFWAGDYFDSPVIQTAATPAGGVASNGADGNGADFFYGQFSLRF